MTNEAQKVVAAVLADNGLPWNLLIERLDYIVTLLEEIRDSLAGQDTRDEALSLLKIDIPSGAVVTGFEWEPGEDEALSA